jgi:hypothetical protein
MNAAFESSRNPGGPELALFQRWGISGQRGATATPASKIFPHAQPCTPNQTLPTKKLTEKAIVGDFAKPLLD